MISHPTPTSGDGGAGVALIIVFFCPGVGALPHRAKTWREGFSFSADVPVGWVWVRSTPNGKTCRLDPELGSSGPSVEGKRAFLYLKISQNNFSIFNFSKQEQPKQSMRGPVNAVKS